MITGGATITPIDARRRGYPTPMHRGSIPSRNRSSPRRVAVRPARAWTDEPCPGPAMPELAEAKDLAIRDHPTCTRLALHASPCHLALVPAFADFALVPAFADFCPRASHADFALVPAFADFASYQPLPTLPSCSPCRLCPRASPCRLCPRASLRHPTFVLSSAGPATPIASASTAAMNSVNPEVHASLVMIRADHSNDNRQNCEASCPDFAANSPDAGESKKRQNRRERVAGADPPIARVDAGLR